MRLDLYLKVSRLCPRRSLAQQLCESQLVFVNGRPAKQSHNVKPDDEIILRRGNHEKRVRVLSVPMRQMARNDAANLYQVLSERQTSDD